MEPTNVGSYRILKKSLQQTRLQWWRGHSALGFSALALTLPLLFAALPAGAAASFTTTNWVASVPVPGIQYTNSSGLVYLKGNVHIHRVLSSDARIAGRLTAWMDLAYQTDGTALLVGPAYVEPGNWDATGTNFTPSGGVWDLKYDGVVQLDGSDQIHLVGYGNGGMIEGLRMECTATKGPGAPFDPAIPYFASGTIKPAPINMSVVLDDFNDGILKPQWVPWSSGTPYLTETNGQLTVRGVWNQPMNDPVLGQSMAYWVENWSVSNGQTLEWRAEVLGVNQNVGWVGLGAGTGGTRFYGFALLSDGVSLYRWTATGGNQLLFSDPVTVRQTNIVLCLALTRHQSQAVVTMRVEDRTAPGTILYQENYLDLTPYLSGNNAALGLGTKLGLPVSDARASFDNFGRRAYEVPQVGIERAVQLSWPATGMNFAVECAPTLQGPWLPLNNTSLPGMQQMTVPVNKSAEFFRLQQSP